MVFGLESHGSERMMMVYLIHPHFTHDVRALQQQMETDVGGQSKVNIFSAQYDKQVYFELKLHERIDR